MSDIQENVPTIDLDICSLDDSSMLASLDHAARRYGTFYITCKEVQDVLELSMDVFDETRSYFNQPLQQKMKLKPLKDGLMQGFMTSKRFAFDEKRRSVNDVRQFFVVPPGLPRPQGAQEYTPATAPRLFPNPNFESATTNYQELCAGLHFKVLGALARCLGVDESAMHELCSQKTSFFVANYYAASAPSANMLGLSAHRDASLTTILCPERMQGLEIQVDGQWVPVPVRPKTLICNLGVAMQKLTNGRFNAILHRVVSTEEERQSLGSFMHANFDTVLQLPGYPSSNSVPELSAESFVSFFRDAVPKEQQTYAHLLTWEATLVQARAAAAANGYRASAASLSSRCSQLVMGGAPNNTSQKRVNVE